MGETELNIELQLLNIHADLLIYGNAANAELTDLIRVEIETMWNEPNAVIILHGREIQLKFIISAIYNPALTEEEVLSNTDPRKNYFRIENYARGNISFVDGLGCNTGYFQADNLYEGSTTAAHEFGHTLGLPHPHELDIRGMGVPGIMYPRGTIVDAQFQYNAGAVAGDSSNGGTMHPRFRKVTIADIGHLKLERLEFIDGQAILGDFSSVWHEAHVD